MGMVRNPTRPLADVNVLPQGNGFNKIVGCVFPDRDLLGLAQFSRGAIAVSANCDCRSWFGLPSLFDDSPPHHMESIVRKLGQILCRVTGTGQVELFYRALGRGDETEDIGTYKSGEIGAVEIDGPKEHRWGRGTPLLPSIKKIVEGDGDGPTSVMGVIVTDGLFEDEEECMEYCMDLGRWLVEHPDVAISLVIVGLGDRLYAGEFERFDDMFEGTDLEDDVDIWSHGVVSDIRNQVDIIGILFGELMTEDRIVARSGRILDSDGNVVVEFPDGVPGRFVFLLGDDHDRFTLQTDRTEIVQDLSSAL